MDEPATTPLLNPPDNGLSRSAAVRCLLALACSHALAPYAVARVTIRYQLDGATEPTLAVVAVAALVIGWLLAVRQLVDQPRGRRVLYGTALIILWFLMSFVQLAIAADSTIPRHLLALLWGVGTIWIGWTVWAWCFFRGRAIIVGSLLAGLGAIVFWNLVDITGLTGATAVELAWRKISTLQTEELVGSQVSETGAIVWPGYLGVDRSARLDSVTLSEDWNSNPPQEIWRVECGAGWSSFAATQTTLFTQEQLDNRDCVTARSLTSGELIWVTAQDSDGFKSGIGGNGPRATPALHNLVTAADDRMVLFAIGPTGVLQCLDATSGKADWSVDVCQMFPGENLTHAICGSPLVVDGMVVVCPPAEDGPCLAAFNINNGSLVWKTESNWQASYSSPVRMNIGGRDQIVVHAGPGVLAVDPQDGKSIWQFDWTNEWNNNATQPLRLSGRSNELIVATGYQGGVVRIVFDAGNDSLVPREVWQSRSTMRTKFCNVSQFGDLLVGLDNGILCGVDVETGKQLWKQGRYGHGQSLHVGDYLLIVAEKGQLHLLRPDSGAHHELAAADGLDRKTWNHPILVHDQLIIRNDLEIVCLKLPLVQ